MVIRSVSGLIAVAFISSGAQAGPLGFLKNLRQRPQPNNQQVAQTANPPAQPAPAAAGETTPANPALNRLSNNRVTRYFTKPATNQN